MHTASIKSAMTRDWNNNIDTFDIQLRCRRLEIFLICVQNGTIIIQKNQLDITELQQLSTAIMIIIYSESYLGTAFVNVSLTLYNMYSS